MSNRKKNAAKKKAKRAAQTNAVTTIPFTPQLREQFVSFNTLMAGARMALDVPAGWVVTPQGTAFVPPPQMPEKKQPDKVVKLPTTKE